MTRYWKTATYNLAMLGLLMGAACDEADVVPSQATEPPAAEPAAAEAPPPAENPPSNAPAAPADTRMTYEAFKAEYLASGRPYAPVDWTPTAGAHVLGCQTSLEQWISLTVTRVEGNSVYVHNDRYDVDVEAPYQLNQVIPHPERTDTEMPAVGSFVLTAPENRSPLWCPAKVVSVEGQNADVEIIHCQRGTDPQETSRRRIRPGEFALVR